MSTDRHIGPDGVDPGFYENPAQYRSILVDMLRRLAEDNRQLRNDVRQSMQELTARVHQIDVSIAIINQRQTEISDLKNQIEKMLMAGKAQELAIESMRTKMTFIAAIASVIVSLFVSLSGRLFNLIGGSPQ